MLRRGDMLFPIAVNEPALNYDTDFVGAAHSVLPDGNSVISSQFVKAEDFPALVLDDWEESILARGMYAEGRRVLLIDGRVVLLPRAVLAAVITICRIGD